MNERFDTRDPIAVIPRHIRAFTTPYNVPSRRVCWPGSLTAMQRHDNTPAFHFR